MAPPPEPPAVPVEQVPRELTPEETQAQAQLSKWKTHHMNQVTQGKAIPALKGSLTRAQDAYKESYRLCQQATETVDDEEVKAQQLQQLDEWELAQLEWQDERDHHRRNLGTSITNKALDSIKSQALNLLPASPTAQSTPNNSFIAPSDQSTASSGAGKPHHSYIKEKLPVFDGDYRAYPRWSRQWKDAQSYYGEDQFFLMLQKNTPSNIDVLANNTLPEVWEQLDARFALTRVVSEAALMDYSAFIPTKKSKNERLIEDADHVNKVYGDLQRVGKGSEMDKTEHLILKVLKWLDIYHKDELVDLFNADEKAPLAQRQGVFQITTAYLKQTRLNLLKYTSFSPQADKPEKPLAWCRVCKNHHDPPF